MDEETRNAKLLRQLKERIDREKTTIRGMSPAERQTLAIVAMVVAVVAVVITLLWAA